MKRLGVVILCVLGACGSKKGSRTEAYPVGISVGAGAVIVGASSCTYEAPASVAKLGASHTSAELVGEGEITETCGETRRTLDVLKPTGVRIDGPEKGKVGAKDLRFVATLVAGARTLTGVTSSNARAMWTQGNDCKDTAAFGPVLGAQNAGGSDIARELVAMKPGTCTIYVELLGQRTRRTVTIE